MWNDLLSCQENVGQKIRDSLGGPSYHVIGHVSQVIELEKTDLDRLLNSAKPHTEDVGNRSDKVTNDKDAEYSSFWPYFIVIFFANIQNSSVGKRHWLGLEIGTLDCRRSSQISHPVEFEWRRSLPQAIYPWCVTKLFEFDEHAISIDSLCHFRCSWRQKRVHHHRYNEGQ